MDMCVLCGSYGYEYAIMSMDGGEFCFLGEGCFWVGFGGWVLNYSGSSGAHFTLEPNLTDMEK